MRTSTLPRMSAPNPSADAGGGGRAPELLVATLLKDSFRLGQGLHGKVWCMKVTCPYCAKQCSHGCGEEKAPFFGTRSCDHCHKDYNLPVPDAFAEKK